MPGLFERKADRRGTQGAHQPHALGGLRFVEGAEDAGNALRHVLAEQALAEPRPVIEHQPNADRLHRQQPAEHREQNPAKQGLGQEFHAARFMSRASCYPLDLGR